jgi:hypothetical protein
LASPTTTLKYFTWVAHDLQSSGPDFTFNYCSTALHAVLNGVAWSDPMADKFFWLSGINGFR